MLQGWDEYLRVDRTYQKQLFSLLTYTNSDTKVLTLTPCTAENHHLHTHVHKPRQVEQVLLFYCCRSYHTAVPTQDISRNQSTLCSCYQETKYSPRLCQPNIQPIPDHAWNSFQNQLCCAHLLLQRLIAASSRPRLLFLFLFDSQNHSINHFNSA